MTRNGSNVVLRSFFRETTLLFYKNVCAEMQKKRIPQLSPVGSMVAVYSSKPYGTWYPTPSTYKKVVSHASSPHQSSYIKILIINFLMFYNRRLRTKNSSPFKSGAIFFFVDTKSSSSNCTKLFILLQKKSHFFS